MIAVASTIVHVSPFHRRRGGGGEHDRRRTRQGAPQPAPLGIVVVITVPALLWSVVIVPTS
ncbi:hypothetical protein DI005_17970 [Prauserella sp. PE36]|uniref:hypothetical protein n=1 Tax=Prauserella sp. PE36 TaxID=1504709 RepID=UPI000DE20377|nr:hypothetical protein [Prauserella sp. PE36]RBM18905.1 hypothetical protein DI005_17970 [Prauserella sp. PE36]